MLFFLSLRSALLSLACLNWHRSRIRISAYWSASRNFSSSSSRKEIVKVPQMAESITEGTLKQWNKKVGDFVKADEEVATIETDKVSFIAT